MLHGGVRAIALDFEHAQLGARGLPLQIEARPQGGETLPRLVEILVVLLGLDGREHLVLQHLELEVRHLVRGLLTLAVVLDARGFVLGPLLRDLLDEIAVLRGLVERQLVLVLPIELHQHLATRDVAARTDQAGDHQGFAPAAAAGLEGHRDDVGPRRLGEAGDAQRAHELAGASGEAFASGRRRCGRARHPRRVPPATATADRRRRRGSTAITPRRARAGAAGSARTLPVAIADRWEGHGNLGSAEYRRSARATWLGPPHIIPGIPHEHAGRDTVPCTPPTRDEMLRLILTSRVYDVCRETPLDPAPRLSRAARRRGPAEARGPAARLQLQAAGRLQQDRAPRAGRARPRRHRRQRRQSRPGRRLLGTAARHPRRDRDAADDAGDQGAGGARPGRRGRARRRQLRRREAALRRDAARHRPDADPALRRPATSSRGRARSATRCSDSARASLSAVFVAIGGGGLISGIGSYIKALMPEVRIIGVEPFEADAMYQSLKAGRRVTLDHVGIFADGVAVREVGELTFALAQQVVDDGRARDQRRDLRGHQGHLRRHAQRHGAGRRARRRGPEGVGRPGRRRAGRASAWPRC